MKLFPQSIIILLLISVFSSCKKGENDPLVSLISRKARLCGEWKVTYEEEQRISYEDGYNPQFCAHYLTENYLFDESIKTGTKTKTGTYNNFDGQNYVLAQYSGIPEETIPEYYTELFTFNKNGTFSYSKTWINSSQKIEYQGTWKFLHKNADRKNKEYITTELDPNSYIYTNPNGITATYPSPNSYGYPDPYNNDKITEYYLKELRNKEIELGSSNEHHWVYGMNSGELRVNYSSMKTLTPNK